MTDDSLLPFDLPSVQRKKVSAAFDGKPTLARHRMVYATLGDRFDTDTLHALSLKTYTPAQWQELAS